MKRTMRTGFAALMLAAVLMTGSAFAQEHNLEGNITVVSDSTGTPLLTVIQNQARQALSGSESAWVGYRLHVREKFANAYVNWTYKNVSGSTMTVSGFISRDDEGIVPVGSRWKNVMFRFERGKGDLPVRFSMFDNDRRHKVDAPVRWIASVEPSRSLAAMRSLSNALGKKKDDNHLFAIIAAHPGAEAQRVLLAEIRSDGDEDIRGSALFWYAMTLEGDDLGELPRLEGELKGAELREKLTFAYHALDSKPAFDRLVNMARTESDPEVREKAVFWIGNTEVTDPMPVLRSIYKSEKNADVREKVIFAASRVEGRAGLDFLIEVARTDPDSDVREKAIFWIGNSNGEGALPLLLDLYKSSQPLEVREKIIFAISRIETKDAMDALTRIALSEDDSDLREKAVFWIGNRDDETEALARLKEIYGKVRNSNVREKIVFAASRIDRAEAQDFLLQVAKSGEGDVAEKAIFWLGRSDDETRALKHLQDIYASNISQDLREKVIFSMSRIETKEAAEALLQIAKTEQNRELKKKALFWLMRSETVFADKYIEETLKK